MPDKDLNALFLDTLKDIYISTSGGPASESECASYGAPGAYSEVPSDVLTVFQAEQRAAAGDSGTSGLANEVTCQLILVTEKIFTTKEAS